MACHVTQKRRMSCEDCDVSGISWPDPSKRWNLRQTSGQNFWWNSSMSTMWRLSDTLWELGSSQFLKQYTDVYSVYIYIHFHFWECSAVDRHGWQRDFCGRKTQRFYRVLHFCDRQITHYILSTDPAAFKCFTFASFSVSFHTVESVVRIKPIAPNAATFHISHTLAAVWDQQRQSDGLRCFCLEAQRSWTKNVLWAKIGYPKNGTLNGSGLVKLCQATLCLKYWLVVSEKKTYKYLLFYHSGM